MLALLVVATLVSLISISLIGLMTTDMAHAAIQYAVARAFYIAQAGLEEAKVQVSAAADPSAYATPAEGVAASFGGGRFTYWADPGTGPETACGAGLKTLEAVGQVAYLNRTISSRVRACGVPGTPFLTALFGVSQVQFEGTSRTYLAPYQIGTPGMGGNLGSFREINFAGNDVRLNALSEDTIDMVSVRERTFPDYALFGFSERPQYNPTPTDDPAPWVLGALGDLIKARPAAGPTPNRCGTPYACVTVGNRVTDVPGVADLREANDLRSVYVRGFREETVPLLGLDAFTFRVQAERNVANAALNARAGWRGKRDSLYTFGEISRILSYLEAHPGEHLRGTVFVDGTLNVFRSVDLGGSAGNVTLAVGGDLVIPKQVTLINRHDLTTVSGRRTPGILVFGQPPAGGASGQACTGGGETTGSGRLVMCEGSGLVVDGLVYTRDGMALGPQASVDQIGAMYHDTTGTANPSFTMRDARVVIRLDPLALTAFGKGIAIVSWQQVH